MTVLEAHGLTVGYRAGDRFAIAVSDVSASLESGCLVGLAGESGCGKSTLALSLAGYRLPGSAVLAGEVGFGGTELTRASATRLRELWGSGIAYLPQDASTALNPALRIGGQFGEALRTHLGLGRREARERATDLLARVAVRDPAAALRRRPHELSGGEQQRAALALAIACRPQVLLLDEPTTGLDTQTQARVISLVTEVTREFGIATLLISHDLTLLGAACDVLIVMYAGQIVESGPARELYQDPRHPYTAALLAAIPTIEGDVPPRPIEGRAPLEPSDDRCSFLDRCPVAADECRRPIEVRENDGRAIRCIGVELPVESADPNPVPSPSGEIVLVARDLAWSYGRLAALKGISFEVPEGRTLGIAGESGSGKTTLLRSLAGLVPARGEVRLGGRTLPPDLRRRSRADRRAIQIVFQNPDSTLNPRHSILTALERPLRLFRDDIARANRRGAAAEMLERVELPAAMLDRLPYELSSGQRQRVAIARAVIAGPRVLLCDEITSALDLSAQAVVLGLLDELRRERRLAVVFVSHDLGLLRHAADDLLVLEAGDERERGPVPDVLRVPNSDYTRGLVAALPHPARAA